MIKLPSLDPVPMTSPTAAPSVGSQAPSGIGDRPRSALWMAAIKPPMYSVAVMPILWGSAIAFYETQTMNWLIFGVFLLSAVLILAWENLANDVFDAETGIDTHKDHSLVNLTGRRGLIFALANGCLLAGLGGIGAIAWMQQDPMVLVLILVCCGLGYLYQGPPFRLGYQGLGEILCFFAFGPLAVSAAYYSQAQTFSASSLVASVILGITTSLVLFCSHFHQVEDDLAAGKRSPIVRLGTQRGAALLPWLCGLTYGLMGLLVVLGLAPLWILLGLLSVPFAVHLCRHVGCYHDQPAQVMNCKFIAVGLHFWSGLLCSLGYGLAVF